MAMRGAILVAAMVLGFAAPASAATRGEGQNPSSLEFNACYDLGWVRGMHVEQGDLPDWMDQCLAGTIPGLPSKPAERRRTRNIDKKKSVE